MPRGKGVTVEHAQLIWATYQDEGCKAARALTTRLGYHRSTFYNIRNVAGVWAPKWARAGPRWSQAQIQQVVHHIENVDPQATLEELIAEFCGHQHFPQISLPTLWRYLDGQLIVVKNATLHNQHRNDPQVKLERAEYAQWFLQNQGMTMIFMDEFGFNLHTVRKIARARRGQRAIVAVARNPGTNHSVMMAVERTTGLIYWTDKDGAMDGEDFTIFLAGMAEEVRSLGLQNVCVILDNCRIHLEEEINLICEREGWIYSFLPPYSPMLNIIEEVINDVKARIKTLLSTTMRQQAMAIDRMPWGQKNAQRLLLIGAAMRQAFAVVDPVHCQAHWNHTLSFMGPCVLQQDV